jgi:FkbM family methyltransferase
LIPFLPDSIKSCIRRLDARFSPLRRKGLIAGCPATLVRTLFWDETAPDWLAAEIDPYFAVLPKKWEPRHIVDAGGSTGAFSLATLLRWRESICTTFEPSRRQRLVLARNARLNGIAARLSLRSEALWDHSTTLRFRSNGAVGGILGVNAALPTNLAFPETVTAVSLDDWRQASGSAAVDLIKMDIEGAEIEALAGAQELLAQDRPVVLVQAYHFRNGRRTLERCRDLLAPHFYQMHEDHFMDGFLIAFPAEGVACLR